MMSRLDKGAAIVAKILHSNCHLSSCCPALGSRCVSELQLVLSIEYLHLLLSQARREAAEESANADADDGVLTVVERMLEEPAGLWHSKKVVLQTSAEIAVVEGGSLQSITATVDAEGLLEMDMPHLCEVCQCASLQRSVLNRVGYTVFLKSCA